MKCDFCTKDFIDILRHLKNSSKCQSVYDIEALQKDRNLARLEKKKSNDKRFYREKKEKILNDRKGHYKSNKEKILENKKQYYQANKATFKNKNAVNYQKSKSLICQRKRFKKCFTRKHAMSYINHQQEHLYFHTMDICQPETMRYLNHSVEFDDGLCYNCNDLSCIKIIGVNRLVCIHCKKAHCFICKVEVSADPSLGYRHYSLIPGYCSIYSIFPNDFASINSKVNQKECKICHDIHSRYPEYELFIENENDKLPCDEKVKKQVYMCNFCQTRKIFVCQFDLHMRNHTKFGQNIAIVALKADIEEFPDPRHVSQTNFLLIEKELMKTNGVIAVLAVFGKGHLERTNLSTEGIKDFNLGAALLLKPGINIKKEISKVFWKKRNIKNVLDKCKVISVRNGFQSPYDVPRSFQSLFLFYNSYYDPNYSFLDKKKDNLYNRNCSLLENRCAVMYPLNVYQTHNEYNHFNPYTVMSNHHYYLQFPEYESAVLQHMWNVIKNSVLCCCVSKFYCTSSTNLEKCVDGCCGKCSAKTSEVAESSFDIESETSSESETNSDKTSKTKSGSENNVEDDFFNNLSS